MINCKPYIDRREWHKWYAWYPIKFIENGQVCWVWREYVSRKITYWEWGNYKHYKLLTD